MTALDFIAWFAVIIIATWLSLITLLLFIGMLKASTKSPKETRPSKPNLTVVPKD